MRTTNSIEQDREFTDTEADAVVSRAAKTSAVLQSVRWRHTCVSRVAFGLGVSFALTGLVFTSLTALSPDTAHSAAPDDDAETTAKELKQTIAKELKQFSNQWAQAFVNKDPSVPKRFFADDFAYIMPDGSVYTKEAFLELFQTFTENRTIKTWVLTDLKVRVYGSDFAVVTGADNFTGTDEDGNPFNLKGRWTNVWVRKGGTWQVVAGHGSKLE
ncbi:MAG: hypothetical protein CMJ78_18475 [Planctomycetaceae bacterium]|nr:hypothetical protein [Planctomycetaceae bacterium]